MKRRGIIATLFGLAGVVRAQQSTGELFNQTGTAPVNNHACNAVPGEQCKPKPANKACPVCGTMHCSMNALKAIVRCSHCNVAFYQDME